MESGSHAREVYKCYKLTFEQSLQPPILLLTRKTETKTVKIINYNLKMNRYPVGGMYIIGSLLYFKS